MKGEKLSSDGTEKCIDALEDKVELAGVVINRTDNSVRYQSHQIKLEPRVLQVLFCLASFEGQVVLREQLIDSIWAGRSVTDDALTRCVSILRRTLKNELQAPLIIETLSKRGYRLIRVPVVEQQVEDKRPASGFARFINPHATHFTYTLGLLTILFSLLLAVLLGHFSSEPVTDYKRTLIAASQDFERYPSFSADGKMFAFAKGNRQKGMQIYVQQLNGQGLIQLTDSEGIAHQPQISPDQTQVAFARVVKGDADNNNNSNNKRRCDILVVPLLGGAEARVGECLSEGVFDMEWTADGAKLLYLTADKPLTGGQLFELDILGGKTRHIEVPLGQGVDDFALSRDGKQIAISVQFDVGIEDIYISNFGENLDWQKATFHQLKVHGLAWSPEGDALFYTSNNAGPFQLWRLSLRSKKTEVVEQALWGGDELSISINGDILIEKWYEQSQMALLPIKAEVAEFSELNIAEMLTSPSLLGDDKGVNWSWQNSPSGKRNVFISDRSGSAEVWLDDGHALRQISREQGPWIMNVKWSPTGEKIAFTTTSDGVSQIKFYDMTRHQSLPDLTINNAANPIWLSEDSLLMSMQQDGSWTAWRYDLAANEKNKVSRNEAYVLRIESPSDKTLSQVAKNEIYYTKPGMKGIWKQDNIALGTVYETKVVGDLYPVDRHNWQIMDGNIYYVRRVEGSAPQLWQHALQSEEESYVTDLPGLLYFGGIDILKVEAAVSQRFVSYAKVTKRDADIEMLKQITQSN